MIFNPLFINDTAGTENIAPAKNKLSGSNYLFSDIINVYMSDDAAQHPDELKNKSIPVTTGNSGNIDVMQILDSNKIDLKKILAGLKTGGKSGLNSLFGENNSATELNLNEKELDKLAEGIAGELPIALLMNLNAEGLSKGEMKDLIISEIKSELLKNNSIVLNTPEGKVKLEVSGSEKGKPEYTNPDTKNPGLVLTEEGKIAGKLKPQNTDLASTKAKVSAEIFSNNLKAEEGKPVIAKTDALPEKSGKETILPDEVSKKIKITLQSPEEKILPKEKAAAKGTEEKTLMNEIPVNKKGAAKLNSESSTVKTAVPEVKPESTGIKAESAGGKEVGNRKDKSVQPVQAENNIKVEAGDKSKESGFFSELKNDIKSAKLMDEAKHSGVKKENVLSDKTENISNTGENKKTAEEQNKRISETENKNIATEKSAAEKITSEEKPTVKITEEKQSSVKNETANEKAISEPKVVEEKKVSDENVKEAAKEKPVQETEASAGGSTGNKSDSNTSEQKNPGFAEVMNQADKKVSEKSDFQMPTAGEKERTVKAPDIIKEISRFIQKSDKSSITLNIEPEQLGKMKIALEMAENLVTAKIEVENEAVKHIVENKINELYSNLSQNGVQLSSVNVSLSQAENKNFKPYAGKKKGSSKDGEGSNVEELEEEKPVKKYGYNTYEFLV